MDDHYSVPKKFEDKDLNNAQQCTSTTLGRLLNAINDPASSSSNQTPISTNTQSQHPIAMQKNVAPFLNKVYNMVNDPGSDTLIHWSADGKSFFVIRHEDFARSVLPRFFKHNNFSSFVRQLNMYGFHKVPHLQNGILHSSSESERWEFSNPHFQRYHPNLLLLVNRKKGRDADEKETPPPPPPPSLASAPALAPALAPTSTNTDLKHILEEIQVIKQHQLNISSQLKTIQSDNTTMWQESTSSRENLQRHQDTIDKILRFLASVFSNDKSVAISTKRQYLLEPSDTNNTDLHDKDHQQQGHENDINNDTSTNSDSERPMKIPRTKKMPDFRLEDYISGPQAFPTPKPPASLPTSISSSMNSTNPTSELDEAIALNDKSKQTSSAPPLRLPISLPQELTQVLTAQQIQGLQNLISLAQSNPALLTQPTSDVSNTHQQQGVTTNNNIPSTATANNKPVPDYSHTSNTSHPNASNTATNSSDHHVTIRPSRSSNTSLTNISPKQSTLRTSNDITSSNTIRSTTRTDSWDNSTTKPSGATPASSSIQNAPRSTDGFHGDFSTLGSSIEALIQLFGLTAPVKSSQNTLGYVDMDQFLVNCGPRNDLVTANINMDNSHNGSTPTEKFK